jgi:dolichol-phosphate mannosyltransferase
MRLQHAFRAIVTVMRRSMVAGEGSRPENSFGSQMLISNNGKSIRTMSLPAISAEPRTPLFAANATTRKGFVSVLVPIYNEVHHVDELLERIHASPVDKEIIIIDDGSTDGTREKLVQLRPSSDVTVIFHQQNCGKGAAIRTGLNYARGEYVLIQDSDLEYDPQDYRVLLEPLQAGQANVVYGVRHDHPGRGLRFFLGARLLTHLANLLYGCGIHDEATCYKVFRLSVLQQLKLECKRFEFCPEVTAKLSRLGEKIAEVPIKYNPRTADEGKKIRHSDGWLAIWTLIRFRFTRKRKLVASGQKNQIAPFPVGFFRAPAE